MNDNYNNLLSNKCLFVIKKNINLCIRKNDYIFLLKEREPQRTP
jgi:hypothetical protein